MPKKLTSRERAFMLLNRAYHELSDAGEDALADEVNQLQREVAKSRRFSANRANRLMERSLEIRVPYE